MHRETDRTLNAVGPALALVPPAAPLRITDMQSGVLNLTEQGRDEFIEAFEHAWRGETVPEVADFAPSPQHVQYFETLINLGRGSYSRTFLAQRGDLAIRLVVLKVSSESIDEADKLAQLQHANIVPFYSVHCGMAQTRATNRTRTATRMACAAAHL